MQVYTFTTANQHLASVLDEATQAGMVRITRDHQSFLITPELAGQRASESPLNVPGIDLQFSAKELIDFVRESRYGDH
jgi:hypothetical protein